MSEPSEAVKFEAGVITNHEGRKFTVVVEPRPPSPLGGRDEPVVGFWDRSERSDFGPTDWRKFGQFTGASYYLDTLRTGLRSTDGRHLSLDNAQPRWTITFKNVREAVDMVDTFLLSKAMAIHTDEHGCPCHACGHNHRPVHSYPCIACPLPDYPHFVE